MRALAFLALLFLAAFASDSAGAHGTLGSNTAHIFLVKDCTAAGWSSSDIGVKCFESVGALTTKIWGSGGIHPTAANPLTVDIGPGEFDGTIGCPPGEGHTTFRGASRDRTTIDGGLVEIIPGFVSVYAAVKGDDCTSLGFQDITLLGGSTTNAGYAVFWVGGGSSSWTDVNIVGSISGWYDAFCDGESTDLPSGVHYFWGSNTTAGQLGYFAECGETWYYGGEIRIDPALKGSFQGTSVGVKVVHRAEVHLFGAAIRASTATISSGSGSLRGVMVGTPGNGTLGQGHGEFHMHGGVISVNSSNLSGVNAIGLHMTDSGGAGTAKSHTLDTAFAVKGGSTSTRLSGTGSFESPQLWEARTTPPTAGGAKDGQDMYVETDCNTSGCSAGSDPHLMIYSSTCSPTPWFDIVRNACRN